MKLPSSTLTLSKALTLRSVPTRQKTQYLSVTNLKRSTTYYISALVKQHVKSVALLQLVTFGYMFRPLPGHHQAKKE